MSKPRNLTEDLPQTEDNPVPPKKVITEDLPQEEDEVPGPHVITED